MIYTVYALVDPDEPTKWRYIGTTTQALNKRVADHNGEVRFYLRRKMKTDSPKHAWIQELHDRGHECRGVEIARIHSRSEAIAMEDALINQYWSQITNVNRRGGNGKTPGMRDSPEAVERKTRVAREGVNFVPSGTYSPNVAKVV